MPNPGNVGNPKFWESSGTGGSHWECWLWNSGGKEKPWDPALLGDGWDSQILRIWEEGSAGKKEGW